MQRQGPATLEGAINHPNHCSNPSLYFTQWIALILFQEKKEEMREKLVMIAMNAAFEDMYKKVFADSYQHGAPQRGVKSPWRL